MEKSQRCAEVVAPYWLDTIKSEIIEITETAAYDYWPPITGYTKPYFNHKLEHIKQVEIESRRLMDIHGGDEDIVIASVWLHDRCKPQIEGSDHANRAADWIAENLASKGFQADKVSAVEYAVRNHNGWTITGLDTLEAKILWDADKIAHQGPSYLVDLMFLFMSEKFYGDRPYSETISLEQLMPVMEMNLRTYNEDVNDKYYFDATKKLHEEKITAMNVFIEGLMKRL